MSPFKLNTALHSYLEIAGPDFDQALSAWLAKLMVLEGVPFENLVADERMLPMESIRFFFVDPNWLDALLKGALSAAIVTERDLEYHEAMELVVKKSVQQSVAEVRSRLLPDVSGMESTEPPTTGLLMRSAIVSGWPGLEVKAFTDKEGTQAVICKRIARLAPDILLMLFPGVPALVTIAQPSEGLHFGVLNLHESDTEKRRIAPRSLHADDCGKQLTGNKIEDWKDMAEVPFRDRTHRVVDVAALAENAFNAVLKKQGDAEKTKFNAGAFGIQMVQAPWRAMISEFPCPKTLSATVSEPEGLDEQELSRRLFGG